MAGSTPLTPEETFVQRWLEQTGITAKKLRENPPSLSCDFRAFDQGHVYWVEVKSRTGDETLREELAEKGTALRQRPLGYHSTMASILDEAVQQLNASSAAEPSFEIVWMLFKNPGEADLHFQQLISTVFGIEDVWDMALGEGAAKPCYFFRESVFFKHKQLDAAVGLDCPTGKFTMCVNAFSSRRPAFLETKLHREFQTVAQKHKVDAILDPAELERVGRAYLADCPVPRRDQEAVLDYVKRKYSLTQPVHYVLNRVAGYATVPKK